jgi:putative tryptophan/tyrosine transport system substrate-binding protein
MKRRQFITLVAGAAVWPLAAQAQQSERVRRIGVLMNLAADDPQSTARVTALAQGLQEFGWTVGRQPLTDQACNDVGSSARGKADDGAHRPRRIGLRPCDARNCRQRGRARGQM